MKLSPSRIGLLLPALLVVISGTGCLYTPNEGDHIGNYRDRVLFGGATTVPGETVEIQAQDSFGRWVTFATATTSTSPQRNEGTNYYVYATRVVVPRQYWSTARELHPFQVAKAEVRVVARSMSLFGGSAPLYTFRQGASSEMNLRDPFAQNLVDYRNDEPSVTIYADW